MKSEISRDRYTIAFALFYICFLIATVVLLTHGYAIGSAGGRKLGTLTLAATLLYTPIFFFKRERRIAAIKKAGRITIGIMTSCIIFAICGEVILRLLYWEGTSFSSRGGPLIERFERDFQFNRFDGPSRGPETAGPKEPGAIRILVQGDSITWGQGIEKEGDLFTTRLRDSFLKAGARVEMAVLARPGREIDGHIEQLRKWGGRLNPDAIIYQWYINDMDIDHSTMPVSPQRFWQIRLIHPPLGRHSYLYFFLDYSLGRLLPASQPVPGYTNYIIDRFSEGNSAWREFVDAFVEWSTLATSLTPHVLVAIYPHMHLQPGERPRLDPGIVELQDRFRGLCSTQGVIVVSLFDSLQTFGDSRDIRATNFDGHPNVAAHSAIADALKVSIVQSWPELFSARAHLPSHPTQ